MQPPPHRRRLETCADAPAKPQAPAPRPSAPKRLRHPQRRADSRRRLEAQRACAGQRSEDQTSSPLPRGSAKADASGASNVETTQGKREENNAPAARCARPPNLRRSAAAAPRQQRRNACAKLPAAPSIGAVTQLRKQVSTPTVVSPDPNSRWRVIAGGTIERSEDGGRIWIPVRVAPNEEVLAGASPGPPRRLAGRPKRSRAACHRWHEFHTVALPRIRRSRVRLIARNPHRHGHHRRRPHLQD